MRQANFLAIIASTILLLSGHAALANGHENNAEKPAISASRSLTMSATVEAINHETREVTLVGPQGDSTSMTAGDAVQNLAQVSVGDVVSAQITENVTIEVFANPEGAQPGTGEFVAEAASEAGAMPGTTVTDTLVISAIVEEINLGMNTFKLRGPEGNVREFVARDAENLRKADVGDLVVITVTESVGIVVETPDGG